MDHCRSQISRGTLGVGVIGRNSPRAKRHRFRTVPGVKIELTQAAGKSPSKRQLQLVEHIGWTTQKFNVPDAVGRVQRVDICAVLRRRMRCDNARAIAALQSQRDAARHRPDTNLSQITGCRREDAVKLMTKKCTIS